MNRSVCYDEEKGLVLLDKVIPSIGDNEVLVKVYSCGICATDIHIKNSGSGSCDTSNHTTLGHEFSGVIEKSNNKNFKKGDFVAIDPNIYCMECENCLNGHKNMCINLNAYGVTIDGGFSEYCNVNAKNLIKVKNLNDNNSLMEPLACVMNGVNKLDIRCDKTVLIIGYGNIGRLFAHTLNMYSMDIYVLDADVNKQLIAKNDGFKIHNEEMCDIVIECAGASQSVIDLCFEYIKKTGELLIFSVPKEKRIFDMEKIFQYELKIYGSFINPDTNLLAAKILNNFDQDFVTHRYEIANYEQAFEAAIDKSVMKVVIYNENF